MAAPTVAEVPQTFVEVPKAAGARPGPDMNGHSPTAESLWVVAGATATQGRPSPRSYKGPATVLAVIACALAVTLGVIIATTPRGTSNASRSSATGAISHSAPPTSRSPQPSVAQIERILRGLPRSSSATGLGQNSATTPPGSSSGPAVSGSTVTPSKGALTASPASGSTPAVTAPASGSNAGPGPSPGSSGGYIGGVQTYGLGQTATVWDPDKMLALATISVSQPQFATSDQSGDSPQFGLFATFTVTVKNISAPSAADSIIPDDSDYYVQVNGSEYGSGLANAGKTDAAEQDNYLGSNIGSAGLASGQSATGTVTIDVPSRHGSLVYAPDGTALGAWSF